MTDETLTPQAVAFTLERAGHDASQLEELLRSLKSQPAVAIATLSELSDHPSFEVRSWVPRAARLALGQEGLTIIKRATHDRDPDIRDAAIEELVALDPREADFLVPELRRRLRSGDTYEPVAAMWTLAQIGAKDALGDVEEVARSADRPWHRKAAEIAVLALRGDGEEIARRIRDHDHDSVPWLAEAARIVGTKECRAALSWCVDGAPDQSCRNACREALDKFEARTSEM
jgi:hypothetical protein